MSVVAVKRYDDKIVIASDSICMRGTQKIQMCKLVKSDKHKHLVAGFVGEGRFVEFGKDYVKNVVPKGNEFKDITAYIDGLIDMIQEFFGLENAVEIYEGFSIILVFNDRIWSADMGCIAEVPEGHYSIGAAMIETDTLMHIGKSPKEAIEIATEINTAIALPVHEEVIMLNEVKQEKPKAEVKPTKSKTKK